MDEIRHDPPHAPPPMKRTRHHVGVKEPTYTEEELEFMKAMDRHKRENKQPFPTWREVLDVLRSLGWRKVAQRAAENTRTCSQCGESTERPRS